MGLIRRHAKRLVRQKIRQPAGRLVRRKVTRPARAALKNIIEQHCDGCGKNVPPFHLCTPKSDFKRRKARNERAQRSSRKGTAGKRAAHDYAACTDRRCQNRLCKAYREGQQACPLPHQ